MAMARVLVEAVWNGAIWGTALAAGVWVLMLGARRASASTRFAVWWVTLAAVVLLPVVIVGERMRPAAVAPATVVYAPVAAAPAIAATPAANTRPGAGEYYSLTSPTPARARRQLPAGLVVLFPALWISGTLLMLARLAWSFAHIRRLRRDARLLRGHPAPIRASWDVPAPMAVGFFSPVILVPEGLDEQLSADEFEQVAFHELAHIRRGDQWTNLAERLAEAVFFFHPAVVWICRRLRFEREIACDDLVLARTGRTAHYAECLARLAALVRPRGGPALATGMAASRRQLSRRIEMVLDKTRNRRTQLSRLGVSLLAVLLAAAVIECGRRPALVAIAQEDSLFPSPPPSPSPLSPLPVLPPAAPLHDMRPLLLAQTQVRGRGRTVHMSNSNLWNSFELKAQGVIEFTDDDRDVKALSSDGSLVIEERRGLSFRKLAFTPGRGGAVERAFYLNGSAQPFDPDGRAWAAEILPRVIRETAVGAPARVERILRQRGPIAVLDEVALMESDHAKRIYLEELIQRTSDTEVLRRAAYSIGHKINSDGEKAQALIAAGPVYLSKGDLTGDYFRAVSSINSDGEHRRVLGELLQRGYHGGAILALMLQSSARISSDGEKAWFLTQAARYYSEDDAVRPAWFKAAGTINSDGERRRALGALLNRRDLSKESLARLLDAAAKMDSDGERAWVLVQAAQEPLSDAAVRQAYFHAVAGMNSDGERRRVLGAVLQRGPSDAATLQQVLHAAARMSADGEKAWVLVAVSAHYLPDDALRKAFFEAVGTIHADGERHRVLNEMLKRSRGSKETLLGVIKSAAEMSSDGEKAAVLAEVSKDCPDDNALIAALVEAAQTIQSDGEYRRVITPLVRKGRTVTIRKL